MILKGNDRGGGRQLAVHLMNSFEKRTLNLPNPWFCRAGPFRRFHRMGADASGTKARNNLQPSLNPDSGAPPHPREYPELLDRTERSLKLVGQPRAVVPETPRTAANTPRRRSCIDTDRMKAVQIAWGCLKPHRRANSPATTGWPARRHEEGGQTRLLHRAGEAGKPRRAAVGTQRHQQGAAGMADIATGWRETGNGAAFVQALEKGLLTPEATRAFVVVASLHGGS
jgi:hypothetical protein